MPIDDRDEKPTPPSPEEKKEVQAALQSETDAPLPPAAEAAAERDADRPQPKTPQGQRRRFLTRRNAFIATLAIVCVVILAVLAIIIAYRLGYIDRYIAGQIKGTLAEYGIRAEIGHFETKFGPRTVEMRDIVLYDDKTGAKLGKIDRILATVRIDDLYALSLKRNVKLQEMQVDGLEVWVAFDQEGNSNFRYLHLPPPEQNSRILFSYSTANIKINNALVHYGDEQHTLSGEGRNIVATIRPVDPNAPEESRMNAVEFSSTNSTFVYDGRPVNQIDITAHGRINQTRAEIDELVLRSPLAEAHLSGVMDDWRNLRYHLNLNSTVDLTQASDILQTGATLRGIGTVVGTVVNDDSGYHVDGSIKADALAADGVRLQAFVLSGQGKGVGKNYEVNGRAVADLLTAGDFQLNMVQLTGGVTGTGTDFRWVGELRAAAARTPQGTIAGLILSDAVAESRDRVLTYSAARAVANELNLQGARTSNVQASDIHGRTENGVTTATIANLQAGAILSSATRIDGLAAGNVRLVSRDNVTNVETDALRVGGVEASGAKVGSLNIAGVRLAIYKGGRVEGSSGDINAGTVALAKTKEFAGGHIDDVRLARPAFVVEPNSRYRVSADLSLGGGVLGQINLGAARAGLVATNSEIQFNNFDANIMGGRATGNATVATARGAASRVATDFNNLDIGSLIATLTARPILITGKATGTANLAFPGTDLSQASGTAQATINAATGNEASGRSSLNGEVALRATRGVFEIERANLKTDASELSATGQFSVKQDASDLQINLASNDAAELQRVLFGTGLFNELEDRLNQKKIELAGKLAFNGTVRGRLLSPSIEGRASLGSLIVNERDLGALAANISTTPDEVRITNGQLTESDGGGIQFALNVPLKEGGSASVDAKLDRVDAGNLLTALASISPNATRFNQIESSVSGHLNITGIPNAMQGDADLRFSPGRIGNQPFQSIVAQATFNGPVVNLSNVVAQLDAGRINASGTFNTSNYALDIEAHGNGIQLAQLFAFAPAGSAPPNITGTADLNAHVVGILSEKDFSGFQINFDGTGHDVHINGRPAGTLALTGRTENRQLNITFTTGILGQSQQAITARVDLGTKDLMTTIDSNISNADLTNLFAMILPQTDVRVTGHATGTFHATGPLISENGEGEYTLTGLKGTANFTDLTVQVEDVVLTAVQPLIVDFTGNQVTFTKTQFTGTNTNVTFGGTLALGAGGAENLTVNGNVDLRLLKGISPDIFFTGTAEANVRVTGSFEQPRINGTASLVNASIAMLIGDQRLTASNVKGSVRFNENQAQIDNLTGMLGGGHVSISGGALLNGFRPTRFQLNVHGDNVVVPYPEDFNSTADVDLELRGAMTRNQQLATVISGSIELRRAEYMKDIDLATLINRRRETIIEQGGESALTAEAQFQDLRIEGRDALVIRNNLAETVGSVSLRVNGPVRDPIISGRISAMSGSISFRNRRYDLQRATIDLPGVPNADPILNIQAMSEIQGYDVIASISGPLTSPTVNVRSDPSLPQIDVVSLIVNGQLSSSDTSTSVLAQSGIGTAASLLTESLINAPARRATDKLFGLNRFEIDPLVATSPGQSPTARLTLGRQINKNLSVTYSTNITSNQEQVLTVEYRVSNRISVIAQYVQGSTTGFNPHNNNFSFEVRLKRRF